MRGVPSHASQERARGRCGAYDGATTRSRLAPRSATGLPALAGLATLRARLSCRTRSYDRAVEALVPVVVVLGAFLAVWLVLVAVIWLHRPSRELALPALRSLPDIVRLARRLLADPRTPMRHRVGLVVLIMWLVSPIDLLPEFLPGIGPLDDIVAAAVILGWIGRETGTARLRELWTGDAAGFSVVARMLRLPAE